MKAKSHLLGTTLAFAAAAMVIGSGTADAAKRQLRHRVARYPYHRYIAYDRAPPPGYGAYPLTAPAPFGAYGTVDEAYGYPPGGIIARRTYENQHSPGLANELDYTVKQTATGGPVGGPLNGGSGR